LSHLRSDSRTDVSLAISHPEAVAVGKRRIIVVNRDDSWTVIEPLLIVSLDYDGARRSRGNRSGN
jgi:hypothetical protein